MPDIGFVNGQFMPLSQAVVSVEDRGFQFGDGVYEVVRTYRGVPFQLDAHLARLERSAEALKIRLPYSRSEWVQYIREGIRMGGYPESKVYIQVTRGVAPRDHAFPSSALPTAVMTVRQMQPLDPVLFTTGVSVITVEDLRWGRCDIKSLNLLPNLMARQRAKEAGAFEAIFVRAEGITEGAVSNVMIVSGDRVVTPPEGPHILSGVTRSVVLELARKAGLFVEERHISLEEFRRAAEIFLTGTTVEILPVVRVDGFPIGAAHPGEVTRRLRIGFDELIRGSPLIA